MKDQLGSPAQLGKLADSHSIKRFLWEVQGGTAPVRSHGFLRGPFWVPEDQSCDCYPAGA